MRSFLFLAALLAFAAACAAPQAAPSAQTSDNAAKPGGVLNHRISTNPFDWDLSLSGKTTPNDGGIAMASNSLLSFKRGPELKYAEMVIEPKLAHRWEVSSDARSFTFQLRQGVKFADLSPVNGRELTSADVKWTYEYWSRSGQFKDKKLPQAQFDWMFEGLDAIETPNKYTAIVRFKEPFVPFLAYAASEWNPIVAKEIFEQDGHLKDRLVGTGHFQLDTAASQKGSRWVWKKNPTFFEEGRPYLDEVRWLVLPDEATAFAGFQTRQVDLLASLSHRDFQEQKKANPQAEVYKHVVPRGSHLYLSQGREGPVKDLRVRRAISSALDRDEVNRIVAGGEGIMAMPGAMADLFTDEEARQLQKYDPAESRRLLAEAGYASGLTLEWPVESDVSRANLTWFELVQAQLKKVGIDAQLKTYDKVTQRAKRYAGDYDIDAGSGLGPLEADNDSLLFGGYHVSSKTNVGHYNDPELNRLLESQRREIDPAKRRDLIRSAAIRISELAYAPTFIYPPQWDMWHPYVREYYQHFGSRTEYTFVWLDK